MPVPDFSPGEVLTAAAMDSIGLWLVKTQTIPSTATTSVTVTDAFSSTYDMYRITITGGSSTAVAPIRVALGSTATAYYYSLVYATYATNAVAGACGNNQGYWLYAGTTPNNVLSASFDIGTPFLTTVSTIAAPYFDAVNAGHLSGYLGNSLSYTSFTVTPDSGTWSNCVIRVYGYRK
jgi:hypothetical protein